MFASIVALVLAVAPFPIQSYGPPNNIPSYGTVHYPNSPQAQTYNGYQNPNYLYGASSHSNSINPNYPINSQTSDQIDNLPKPFASLPGPRPHFALTEQEKEELGITGMAPGLTQSQIDQLNSGLGSSPQSSNQASNQYPSKQNTNKANKPINQNYHDSLENEIDQLLSTYNGGSLGSGAGGEQRVKSNSIPNYVVDLNNLPRKKRNLSDQEMQELSLYNLDNYNYASSNNIPNNYVLSESYSIPSINNDNFNPNYSPDDNLVPSSNPNNNINVDLLATLLTNL